jgi:dTDP-4-amino-4,6-dideoxygalactose transaminase
VLLFDAAQAIGSRYRDRRVGAGGRAEVFSLSPTKLARMSELHAALGLASLEMLEPNIAHRLRLISLYREGLGRLPGLRFQRSTPETTPNGVYFSILVDPAKFGLDRATRGAMTIRRCIGSPSTRRRAGPTSGSCRTPTS